MPEDEELLLTTAEYAAEKGVSRRTVQRWVANGQVFGVQIGRTIRIPFDEPAPFELDNEPEPEIIPDEPDEEVDELEGLTPEEIDALDDDDAPFADPGDFPHDKVRNTRHLASLADAEAYAEEIPVPTSVWKNPITRLYFVVVEYP